MTFVLTFIDMMIYSSGMRAKDMIGHLVEMVDCPSKWGKLGWRGVVVGEGRCDGDIKGVNVWWVTGDCRYSKSGGYFTHRFKLCGAAPLMTSEQAGRLPTITDDFHIKMVIAALGGIEKLKTMEVG